MQTCLRFTHFTAFCVVVVSLQCVTFVGRLTLAQETVVAIFQTRFAEFVVITIGSIHFRSLFKIFFDCFQVVGQQVTN